MLNKQRKLEQWQKDYQKIIERGQKLIPNGSFDNVTGTFNANGKFYKVDANLTAFRMVEHEKFKLGSVGLAYDDILEAWKFIHTTSHKGQHLVGAITEIANKSTEMVNAMNEGTDTGVSHYNVLKMLTFFLNTADEDTTTWSEALAAQKIDDWYKSGIPYSEFFFLWLELMNITKKYLLDRQEREEWNLQNLNFQEIIQEGTHSK